jgi:hypothetical protein
MKEKNMKINNYRQWQEERRSGAYAYAAQKARNNLTQSLSIGSRTFGLR